MSAESGKQGKILLVGFGPGAAEQMTFRARAAIEEADVVIGYSTYIKLVRDLLDGKEVIRKGMTEEIDRCVEAYEAALRGKVVALISSGDVGVYGMAGPTYEVLLQQGWTPDSDITVEIVPGTTALNACASLVGAPLTHDFCSISLSDLLTPWPVIRKRIAAAGAADFVIALYNPKSGRRTEQIVEAQRLLLRHRAADTPVAIVKSAYRRRQHIQMTTLEHMAECEIGMLTTVIIGNSSSFVREGLLITPRGYHNKYDAGTGETREGERSGRSLAMGLEGWGDCLRHWLAHEGAGSGWETIARHFDVPLGEVLGVLARQPVGDYRVAQVPSSRWGAWLSSLGDWQALRAVVRAPGGAITECLLSGQSWSRKGDWLNCVTDHFHLHIDWSQVVTLYAAWRSATSMGFHALDGDGNLLFRLLLISRDGVIAGEDHDRFRRWLEGNEAV